MDENVKTRYSDAELEEFRAIICEKLSQARAEYDTLRKVVMHNGSNIISMVCTFGYESEFLYICKFFLQK